MTTRTDGQVAAAQAAETASDYWSQSRRPLASLLFSVPLLVIYEAGLICLAPNVPRNGADAWLRQTLDLLGFSAYFLLPILTAGILLGWHYVARQPWRVSRRVLYGMAFECLSLAAAYWFFWSVYQFFWQRIFESMGPMVGMSVGGPPPLLAWRQKLGTLVGYFGAGIYEELLFRLILLNLAIGLLIWLKASPRASVIGGIALTSVLFSAAHYIGHGGEEFLWRTFLFRVLAGVFFAVLFRFRGYGIAAGSHAFYDVLVGLSKIAG
jgi:membrane protease YdiL (CAAX protease family)